jgi:peptidoglycan-associated lipoprotein
MTRPLVVFLLLGAAAACSKSRPEETLPSSSAKQPKATSDADNAQPSVTATVTPAGPSAPALSPIMFAFDSTELSAESRTMLESLASYLQATPGARVTIEGNTDEKGTIEYNVALGDKRARAARDYLVRLGVEEARVNVVSYGEARPAAADTDEANRRDEVKVGHP